MSTIADELLTLLDAKESLRLAINAQGNDLKVNSPLTIFAQGIRPVDTEMSLTSENLVQNKVITKYIDDKIKRLTDLYSPLGKYIYDLAVERYIVEHSIDNKEKDIHYYLIVLNAEYIYNGLKDEKDPIYGPDDNGNLLFKIYDMTYITSLIQENIELKKKMLEYDQDHLTVNYHRFGTPCEYKKTTACKFFPICAKRILKDGSILEYMHKNYAFKNANGEWDNNNGSNYAFKIEKNE